MSRKSVAQRKLRLYVGSSAAAPSVRNPVALALRQRQGGAGSHRKSASAARQAEKRALRKELRKRETES